MASFVIKTLIITTVTGIVLFLITKKPKSDPSLTNKEITEQLEKIHDRELQMLHVN
jgi:hypothetical protein